jgi:hypothetical protein
VCLESWLNTYQPPLSAGGNVGVSAEVQDGIYQNVHAMTVGSSDALHRMLAFEKEHAQMRTKCTDEAVRNPLLPVHRSADPSLRHVLSGVGHGCEAAARVGPALPPHRRISQQHWPGASRHPSPVT